MNKTIHIVSFDVPYPPDYGGVMDVFYRIVALFDAGFDIHLHCFEYGRGEQKELEKYTKSVTYYQRLGKFFSSLKKTPMIVASRSNQTLLANLLIDKHPILFEGQHCTAFLNHPKLKNRTKLVRIHNVEHHYYKALAANEKSTLKRAFFKQEAAKLKKTEHTLALASHLLCITEKDKNYYATKFNNVSYLPVAFPLTFSTTEKKKQPFTLFHGNLSVGENINAVNWLLRDIAPRLNHKLIIAGKNPTKELVKKAAVISNVELVENPDKSKMQTLMDETKAHLLITFQKTGIKLKLLNALTTNGDVVVNQKMVENTNLAKFCTIKETATEFINYLNGKAAEAITPLQFEQRKTSITAHYSPDVHVEIINDLL